MQPESKTDCEESLTQTFWSGFMSSILRKERDPLIRESWDVQVRLIPWEKADLKLVNDVTGKEQWWSLTAVKMRLICCEIAQCSRLLAASSSDWAWSNESHTTLAQIMAWRHDSMLQSYPHWFLSDSVEGMMQQNAEHPHCALSSSTSGWKVNNTETWQSSLCWWFRLCDGCYVPYPFKSLTRKVSSFDFTVCSGLADVPTTWYECHWHWRNVQ